MLLLLILTLVIGSSGTLQRRQALPGGRRHRPNIQRLRATRRGGRVGLVHRRGLLLLLAVSAVSVLLLRRRRRCHLRNQTVPAAAAAAPAAAAVAVGQVRIKTVPGLLTTSYDTRLSV
jgi:hypothetical protein